MQLALDALDDVDVEDFVYVATYADLPIPTVDEVGKLYYVRAAESMYTVFPETEFGTLAIGGWSGGLSRTGFFISGPEPAFIPGQLYAGTYIYFGYDEHFYRGSADGTRWIQVSPAAALAGFESTPGNAIRYIGQLGSDGEAIGHVPSIAANTDYFYVRRSGNNFSLHRLALAGYSPASAPTTIYEWGYAVDHVTANPVGTTTDTLRTVQINDVHYSLDLVGGAISLRDLYRVGYLSAVRDSANIQNVMGNIYQAGLNGGLLLKAECWVDNSDGDR